MVLEAKRASYRVGHVSTEVGDAVADRAAGTGCGAVAFLSE
jgi:hypothetical protein